MAGLVVFLLFAAGGFMLTLFAIVGDDPPAGTYQSREPRRLPGPAPVLVLGGGFAGASVARALSRRGVEVTIVSPENYMLYTPMLPEAASGAVEPRHAVVPLRELAPRTRLVLGRAISLDPGRRSVTVEPSLGRLI